MVVNGIAGGGRVLDSEVIFQIAARKEVIEVAARAVQAGARLQHAAAAAIESHVAAVFERAGAGLEIDDARVR